TLPFPIYDLAFDARGGLWAATGGGPLLELDPSTGVLLGQYGDGLTQTLALDPASGLIYVASGNGVEVFDPVARSFHHFSNVRVGSLAFAPDGTLWAATWPQDENTVVKFDAQGHAQAVLTFGAPVDSIAFGLTGSPLAGLLFVSHDAPAAGETGTD